MLRGYAMEFPWNASLIQYWLGRPLYSHAGVESGLTISLHCLHKGRLELQALLWSWKSWSMGATCPKGGRSRQRLLVTFYRGAEIIYHHQHIQGAPRVQPSCFPWGSAPLYYPLQQASLNRHNVAFIEKSATWITNTLSRALRVLQTVCGHFCTPTEDGIIWIYFFFVCFLGGK